MHAAAYVTYAIFIALCWGMSESRSRYVIRSSIPLRFNVLDDCKPCLTPEECNEPPVGCIWGESNTRNVCNKRQCAQGPDEPCGYPEASCGIGLTCHSEARKCVGCSLTKMMCSSEGP